MHSMAISKKRLSSFYWQSKVQKKEKERRKKFKYILNSLNGSREKQKEVEVFKLC